MKLNVLQRLTVARENRPCLKKKGEEKMATESHALAVTPPPPAPPTITPERFRILRQRHFDTDLMPGIILLLLKMSVSPRNVLHFCLN